MEDILWSSCTQDADFDKFSKWDTNACLAPSVDKVSGSYHCSGDDCEQGDDRVESASKNHKEAEKRRRDRINAHLATLRKMNCNSDKVDKATLLGKVIEHLKELKSETTRLSKLFTFPKDSDDVVIDLVSNTTKSSNNTFIQVSLSCEDRRDLISEINRTLKSLRLTLTIVQADMTCFGGRMKCNFTLHVINNTSANEMLNLKDSLKVLFGQIVSSSSWSSLNYRIKSKRQRFFCSSDYETKGFNS